MLEKNLKQIILKLIQTAIVDARNLSYEGNSELAADVLDAVEGIPLHLTEWTEDSLETIQTNLRCFRERYAKSSISVDPDQFLFLPREIDSLSQWLKIADKGDLKI